MSRNNVNAITILNSNLSDKLIFAGGNNLHLTAIILLAWFTGQPLNGVAVFYMA
ncbi:hypothetical protein EMIT091MI3_160004 [Kosakonia quasisacchari]